jgi:hypothetical protein
MMIPGVGAMVSGDGSVPLGTESHNLAREFLDALQKLVIVRRFAKSLEREWGDNLDDAVCTVDRGVQLDLWKAGKSGLYLGESRLVQMLRRK